jgi:hypothetical protein
MIDARVEDLTSRMPLLHYCIAARIYFTYGCYYKSRVYWMGSEDTARMRRILIVPSDDIGIK